jgi:hypothetical protein
MPFSLWNFIDLLSISKIKLKSVHNGCNLYYVAAGFIGGDFIKRTKIRKPGQEIYTSEPPECFGAQDFYVGNILVLHGFEFVLVDADEYTLRYMEVNCQEVSLFRISIIVFSFLYFNCIETFKPPVDNLCCFQKQKILWDVVVQDTHILVRTFAAAMDGWLGGCINMDLFSLYSFGWTI